MSHPHSTHPEFRIEAPDIRKVGCSITLSQRDRTALESALRNLAIEKVKAKLNVHRLEREELIRTLKSNATHWSVKAAVRGRLAKIEYESRGLAETLEQLLSENGISSD